MWHRLKINICVCVVDASAFFFFFWFSLFVAVAIFLQHPIVASMQRSRWHPLISLFAYFFLISRAYVFVWKTGRIFLIFWFIHNNKYLFVCVIFVDTLNREQLKSHIYLASWNLQVNWTYLTDINCLGSFPFQTNFALYFWALKEKPYFFHVALTEYLHQFHINEHLEKMNKKNWRLHVNGRSNKQRKCKHEEETRISIHQIHAIEFSYIWLQMKCFKRIKFTPETGFNFQRKYFSKAPNSSKISFSLVLSSTPPLPPPPPSSSSSSILHGSVDLLPEDEKPKIEMPNAICTKQKKQRKQQQNITHHITSHIT